MSNPVLQEKILKSSFNSLDNDNAMSISGTIMKTFFLSLLTFATFACTWYAQLTDFTDKAYMLSKFGLFGGLGTVLLICFLPKNKSLIITTPIYAMCEGLALGYISAVANQIYPNIVPQAALGTICALLSMLFLYKTQIIKCNDKFRSVIITATFAIFAIYIIQLILGLFGIHIPGLFSNSPIGIGFSAVVVLIASFNLILDFDCIEKYSGLANKDMEWYFGFSLLVTIIWLYIEILNLLIKIQSRNN